MNPDVILLMPKLNFTIRSLTCLTALVAVFLGGFFLRGNSEGSVTIDELDVPLEILELDLPDSGWEFKLDDLAPCDKSNAQYVLIVHALKNGEPVNSWSQEICVNDGTNIDSENPMLRHMFSCAAGPRGGCSGSVRMTESTTAYMNITVSWGVSFDGNHSDFRAALLVQPNARGEVRLSTSETLTWQMEKPAE